MAPVLDSRRTPSDEAWPRIPPLLELRCKGGGARHQRTKSGFATKREAVAAMNELQESVFYDACELHVRAYITPRIGDVPLQALTAAKIKSMYAELRKSGRARGGGPLSAKTVHNIHRTLSRGPQRRRRRPADHEQPRGRPTPPAGVARDADVVAGRAARVPGVRGDPYAALWRLAATTGLRRGELAGLRWRDIDFDAGRVGVAQQRAKGGGGVEAGPTKTRRSRRLVAIDDRTLEALRDHRKQQVEMRLLFGPGFQDHDMVFCLIDGRPLHPDRLTQMFRERCKASGLP